MRFLQHRPSLPLSRFVDFFWFYDGWREPHQLERVLPDGTFELIINLRDEPRHTFKPDDLSPSRRFRRAWIAGMHSKYAIIDTVAGGSMIGVHFRHSGANLFLGVPSHELNDRIVEIENIWGADGIRLRDRVLEAEPVQEKFRILASFLLGRLGGKTGEKTLEHAVKLLTHAPESARIRDIAAEIGWSQKHLIDEFWQNVGMSPKRFGRVQRCQRAIHALQRPVATSWTELALECGYYDQAHFNAEFKHFTGLTPSAFVAGAQGRSNFIPLTKS